MVRNYRNINSDVKVVLRLAVLGLSIEYKEIQFRDDPRELIADLESKKKSIERLESAIKS